MKAYVEKAHVQVHSTNIETLPCAWLPFLKAKRKLVAFVLHLVHQSPDKCHGNHMYPSLWPERHTLVESSLLENLPNAGLATCNQVDIFEGEAPSTSPSEPDQGGTVD